MWYVPWYTVHSVEYTCDLILARIWLLGLCPFYKPGVTFWVWSREVSETQPSHHLRRPNSPVLDSFSPHWAYVLPPMTYSHRFSTIFILPWFVCTRMDIVPCAGAMYNISNRNEPFPFRCGPFPFFVQGYIPMVVRPMFSPPMTYSPRFSSIFTLAWFVSTRMDIVPCAGAMYNISDRNEPFPSHYGPLPFFG